MQQPLVKTEHLGLTVSQHEILRDINFEIYPDQIITVIGPNGAGKSTLLKVILGLLKPTQGHVQVQKGTIIGYMPQRLHLDRSFPITVDYFLRLTGSPRQFSVQEVLQNVGASKLQHQSMHDLSGGELQRVLLARALMSKPNLLILDEPVQGVDINGQKALYALLADIRKRWRCAMVLVSHDMHMVFSASDQVICLNMHICCQGKPEAIIKDPHFTELFGTQIFAPYKHEHDHQHDLPPDIEGEKNSDV